MNDPRQNAHQFERIARIVRWLDMKRWEDARRSGYIDNPIFIRLSHEQKILVHWLCYITDRRRPWQEVWTNGGQVFSELVDAYVKDDCASPADLRKLLSRTRFLAKGKEIDAFRSLIHPSLTFAARFPADLFSIARTLVWLFDYRKSVTRFLDDLFPFWGTSTDMAGWHFSSTSLLMTERAQNSPILKKLLTALVKYREVLKGQRLPLLRFTLSNILTSPLLHPLS